MSSSQAQSRESGSETMAASKGKHDVWDDDAVMS
jgi:hypothetical protein